VIERRGVPTGLITTRGFRDVLEIGRQVRPHLYDYTVRTPLPLVPRERRLEVAERIDAAGALVLPLDEAAVAAAADALAAQGVQAIAICFLHSYLNDSHERRAADIVRARLPDVYLSTSSGVLPEFREFERFSTTAINAYIGPRMERYLDRFLGRLSGLGLTVQPYTIHSNGGLMSVNSVRQFPVRCCLSGPAAGVVGAAEVARAAGFSEVITFDAGGTSTDVSLIERGMPAFASSRTIADYPFRSPMVDVQVIGAGGGSGARCLWSWRRRADIDRCEHRAAPAGSRRIAGRPHAGRRDGGTPRHRRQDRRPDGIVGGGCRTRHRPHRRRQHEPRDPLGFHREGP
jgi:N-methylhydantoinase A